MKTGYRGFFILALATAGASIAAAQSSSSAYAYAGATFISSGQGVYFESQGYTGGYYGFFGSYRVSDQVGTYGASFPATNEMTAYAVAGSDTAVWPVDGGSGAQYGIYAICQAFIYNGTNTTVNLSVTAETLASGSSDLGGWNSSATSDSYAWVSLGSYYGASLQEVGDRTSFTAEASDSESWQAQGYDLYNGNFGSSFTGSGLVPGNVSSSIDDSQTYSFTLAPMEVLEVDLRAFEGNASFATTPAPAALVPFGAGIVGLVRKRRRHR
jgi:hypothetical protein